MTHGHRNSALREFFRAIDGSKSMPLEPGDPAYVPRLAEDPAKDPISALAQRIDWSESESVNVLTGFRGNGKSTELRRLKRLLEDQGCVVLLMDMLEYVLMTKQELPRLARFFDHNLIMNYQNGGEPWYDIPPLVVGAINRHSSVL